MVRKLSYVISFLGCTVLAGCILLCAIMVAPKLFGLTPYTVLTGSMEPAIPVGALIYVQDVDTDTLGRGNVITFERTSSDGRGSSVVTHRIIEDNVGGSCFITKGDANDIPDPQPISYSSVLGKAVIAIPSAGVLALAFDSWNGKMILLTAVFCATILCLVGDVIRRSQKRNVSRV